jgi:protein-L-isoaspartate O-methyltransferase
VRYSEAVFAAPPGSAQFQPADLARITPSTLHRVLAPAPSAPPLEDVAAALGQHPRELFSVAAALEPARGERLLRLSQRPLPDAERAAAGDRLVRGLFWTLVYELEPERWVALAEAEPISPQLLRDLPAEGARVVEVGAGAGRLTAHLAGVAAMVVALEPCPALRERLRRRSRAHVVAGVTQQLPLVSGWADLATAGAAMGSQPPLGGPAALAELERVVRPGGTVALISPQEPEWFQARGYELREYPVPEVTQPPDLTSYFGSLRPPNKLLIKMV